MYIMYEGEMFNIELDCLFKKRQFFLYDSLFLYTRCVSNFSTRYVDTTQEQYFDMASMCFIPYKGTFHLLNNGCAIIQKEIISIRGNDGKHTEIPNYQNFTYAFGYTNCIYLGYCSDNIPQYIYIDGYLWKIYNHMYITYLDNGFIGYESPYSHICIYKWDHLESIIYTTDIKKFGRTYFIYGEYIYYEDKLLDRLYLYDIWGNMLDVIKNPHTKAFIYRDKLIVPKLGED